jgi:hypothetical protein
MWFSHVKRLMSFYRHLWRKFFQPNLEKKSINLIDSEDSIVFYTFKKFIDYAFGTLEDAIEKKIGFSFLNLFFICFN